MNVTPEQEFLRFSAEKLRALAGRIDTCVAQLTDDQVWLRGSENVNAVGNLCLHLAGNLRQWIGHGVAGKPDIRVRDREFAARGGVSTEDLRARLATAVEEAATLIAAVSPNDLVRRIQVQKYDITVLEAIYHVVEHFAGHAGQIIFVTKALKGEDLGFYRHLTGTTSPPPPPEGQEQP